VRHFCGILSSQFLKAENAACWALLYLGANKEWKDKVIAEVRNLISTYTSTTSSVPIHQRLSMIPMSAWEDEMPVVDNIIRETLRLVKTGAALRRNLTDNLQVADTTINNGAFLIYSMADVHLNESIYSEPLKFDPGRFVAPREEDKRGNGFFLGWGTGRHPCSGRIRFFIYVVVVGLLMMSLQE
jgi:cytochrome P450